MSTMTNSMNLITAQISFLSSHLVLVHIPNEWYSFLLQPLLRILFGEDIDEDDAALPWTVRHDFLNISITPVGCSLICSKYLVDKYVTPLAEQLNSLLLQTKSKSKASTVDISDEEYVVVQVDGQGLDAGQRVLELTGPLAMAGISIFFITTYFSDYILVPVRARQTVITTLQQRGFVFSAEAEAYVSQLSPLLHHNHLISPFDRPQTASSSGSEGYRPYSNSVPTTPPAKDIPELQLRTFTKLMKNGIEPIVDPQLRLVNCAGSVESETLLIQQLKEDLLQVLLSIMPTLNTQNTTSTFIQGMRGLLIQDVDVENEVEKPVSFLSLTLSAEPVSILMEEKLLPKFRSSVLCSKDEDEVLVPIILDLSKLGWTATGIVGGVAGRLSQESASYQLNGSNGDTEPVELGFLSSAKAGSVIVHANQLDKAIKAFEMGMEEVKGRK